MLPCLALVALAGCGGRSQQGGGTTTQPSETRAVFGYDAAKPLGYADHGIVLRRGAVSVHDVFFESSGQRIDGYLVLGTGGRRRPGLVLVHGSGADRSELLGAAVALAMRGFVALTITEPSSGHPPPVPRTNRQLVLETRAVTRKDVIAVRRAADVLATLPTVDPRRLGYLGWSAGAKTGAFVAAADSRFKSLVLLSAGADQLTAFVDAAPKPLRALVHRVLGSVDPIHYLALARPGSVLMEDGRKDEVVPRSALLNMIHAAPPGTVVRWYPAGHSLSLAAYRDAFVWLGKRLGAGSSP